MAIKIPAFISVPVSAFAAGTFEYLIQHNPGTANVADWKPTLGVAVLTGLVAVAHLYMTKPGSQPVVASSQTSQTPDGK